MTKELLEEWKGTIQKGLQNNSGPMLSLKLAFIAISCAQSETVEEISYSAPLLTAADRCKKKACEINNQYRIEKPDQIRHYFTNLCHTADER